MSADPILLRPNEYQSLVNGDLWMGKIKTRKGILQRNQIDGYPRGVFLYTNTASGAQTLVCAIGNRFRAYDTSLNSSQELLVNIEDRDASTADYPIEFVQAENLLFVLRGKRKPILMWNGKDNALLPISYEKKNSIAQINTNGKRLEFTLESSASWRPGNVIVNKRDKIEIEWDDMTVEQQEEYYDDKDKIVEGKTAHTEEETERAKKNYEEYVKDQFERKLTIDEIKETIIERSFESQTILKDIASGSLVEYIQTQSTSTAFVPATGYIELVAGVSVQQFQYSRAELKDGYLTFWINATALYNFPVNSTIYVSRPEGGKDGWYSRQQVLYFYGKATEDEMRFWNKGEEIELQESSFIDGFPETEYARYIAGRIYAASRSDELMISDILDPISFDYTKQSFQVNAGDGGKIMAFEGYRDDNICVFKDNTVYILQNIYSNISQQSLFVADSNDGIVGKRAYKALGDDIFYFTKSGIKSLSQNNEGRLKMVQIPLSIKVNPIIESIDWSRADKIIMENYDNKLLIAFSKCGEETNSRILVFDLIYRTWTSVWVLPSFSGGIYRFLKIKDSSGRENLHFMNDTGQIYMMMAGEYYDEGSILGEKIQQVIPLSFDSRGFAFQNQFAHKVLAKSEFSFRYADPNISVSVGSSELFNVENAIDQRQFSSTDFTVYGKAPCKPNNLDNRINEPFRENYSPVLMQPSKNPEPPLMSDEYIYLWESMFIDAWQSADIEANHRMHGKGFSFTINNTQGIIILDSIIATARVKTLGREKGE